jgi:DNA-binding MarR family transcriptional regulator
MSEKSQFVKDLIHWMELSTTRSMRHWGHYVRETGLSMPQFGLMMHLYHHRSCGMTEISQHSGASNAATSQLVNRLVDKQLVERTENQNDRRSKRLTLTPKGRMLVETSIGERYRWVEELAAHLSRAEQEKVSRALPALLRSLEEIDTAQGNHPPLPADPN